MTQALMQKNIIRNEKLGEEYFSYLHPTGLTILLYPMAGFRSSYALFGTTLGSIDTTFKTSEQSEFTVVPEGIAHFLEHKLFESEDGDAFSLFAKTGASANAYTSFDRTCYLFSTTQNFSDSLTHLLTFVQSPYFTEQTVQKEQGIISQEIKMYQDNPGWRVFFNLLTGLYSQHPVRLDIAGSVDSIAKIDASLLYQCYHTFYNLNNMVLAIAGNFDPDQAMEVIEKSLKPSAPVEVQQHTPQEPREIFRKITTQQLAVSMPLFQIGFKEQPKMGKELLEYKLYSEIILDLIAGEGSDLYRRLYDEELITQSFGVEVFAGRGFFTNIFAGESKDPQKVYDLICQEVKRTKGVGILQKDFDRLQKALYGRTVGGFNNVSHVANALVSAHFYSFNLFDSMDMTGAITCEGANKVLQESLLETYCALSIVNPLET